MKLAIGILPNVRILQLHICTVYLLRDVAEGARWPGVRRPPRFRLWQIAATAGVDRTGRQ